MKVPVHECFKQTIQGEGYWTGVLCDFIRLHGCPVGCPFCDSLYAPQDGGGRKAPRTLIDIETLVSELAAPRVVITGGEPLIHSHLPHLIDAILKTGRAVSLETSGAFWQDIHADVWVTLSPKTHVSPRFPVHEAMWQRADEIKIVVVDGTELAFYKPYLNASCQNLYLQPEWDNRANTVPLVMEQIRSEWAIAHNVRLSLQSHKYLGLD